MRKYENFCNALSNMKDIYNYAGMIRDEEQWLRALQARNNVTHSYNQKIALGIIADAKEEFYQMFCELKTEIEENWL